MVSGPRHKRYGNPTARRAAKATSGASGGSRILGGDGIIELAVVDHFSPHASIHETTGVFDEHSVEVGIDRSESLTGIDYCIYWRGCGRGGEHWHRGIQSQNTGRQYGCKTVETNF